MPIGCLSTEEALGEYTDTTGNPVSIANSSPAATDMASGKENAVRNELEDTIATTKMQSTMPRVSLFCAPTAAHLLYGFTSIKVRRKEGFY